MASENDDFVSDETGSLAYSDSISQNEVSNLPSLVERVGISDPGRTPGQNELSRWANEQARVDQIVCEAAEWEKAATFFPKRDQWLNEALRLAYPVYLLFSLRRDEAEAQLMSYPAALDLPKKLIQHKPALAALKLVTKPKNADDEKKCSEWANKLFWAHNNSIMPSEFHAYIEKISLADAKSLTQKSISARVA